MFIYSPAVRAGRHIVTGNLGVRLVDHANCVGSAYAARWNISALVHFEEFQFIDDAIRREKQLKGWKRQWKFDLIEEKNPTWEDLSAW